MIDKDFILFDLDGTLTDPKLGIVNSIQYALRSLGVEADPDSLVRFIGPPLHDTFKSNFGFNDDEAKTAIDKYREYYAGQGMYENSIYSGIPELLRQLRETKKSLIVATSKPTFFAEKILAHFKIAEYFDFVSGSELDGRRSKKSEVIQFALDYLKLHAVDRAIMTGDREMDIFGAKDFGMDSIGVLYGYGSLQELTAAGATYIAASVTELSKLLCPV